MSRSVSKQDPLKLMKWTDILSFMLSSYAMIASLKLISLKVGEPRMSFAKCRSPTRISLAYISIRFSNQSCFYFSTIDKHLSKYSTDSSLFSSLSSRSITAVVFFISWRKSLHLGYSILGLCATFCCSPCGWWWGGLVAWG